MIFEDLETTSESERDGDKTKKKHRCFDLSGRLMRFNMVQLYNPLPTFIIFWTFRFF